MSVLGEVGRLPLHACYSSKQQFYPDDRLNAALSLARQQTPLD